MKSLIALGIFLLAILAVWMFPVIISFITWNFWYIFLYIVWWVPAMIISAMMLAALQVIDK